MFILHIMFKEYLIKSNTFSKNKFQVKDLDRNTLNIFKQIYKYELTLVEKLIKKYSCTPSAVKLLIKSDIYIYIGWLGFNFKFVWLQTGR